MLIIGHRGAAGLAPENTLEALQAGFDAGADILEFDVRLTSDNVPILAHDAWIKGKSIRKHTYEQLQRHQTVTTLDEALEAFFGKVLLNIELKQSSGIDIILNIVKRRIKQAEDWEDVLFSSFKPSALIKLQTLNNNTNLALLHHINPFLFMRYHKRLRFSAVGFHRLHVNPLALAVAQKLGVFTYVYTIDSADTAKRFARKHIDGIVTNYPDRLIEAIQIDS